MEVRGLNGSKQELVGYEKYSKKMGIFKGTQEIKRYDLANGETYLVLPTELLEMGIVKTKLNEFIKTFGVKVTK